MSKEDSNSMIPVERIERVIYFIRDQKVILDRDLASLYDVETGAFNRAVKRNIERFPQDFAFRLTKNEWTNLMCQFGISRSWGGYRKLPWVFTEQGVAMLSGILRSPQAVAINIEIMRAFIRMRYVMASHKELSKEMAELKSFLLKHSNSNDREFRKIWQTFEKLSKPPEQEKRRIGFDLN